MANKIYHKLCLQLKFLQGFIPSIANPIRKFLDSTQNPVSVSSIIFHY